MILAQYFIWMENIDRFCTLGEELELFEQFHLLWTGSGQEIDIYV
jgi:hypothetical protein